MKICCDVLGRRAIGFSKFASLACAISNTATAVDLLCSWKLYASTFSPTCSYNVEKENMIFLGSKRNS